MPQQPSPVKLMKPSDFDGPDSFEAPSKTILDARPFEFSPGPFESSPGPFESSPGPFEFGLPPLFCNTVRNLKPPILSNWVKKPEKFKIICKQFVEGSCDFGEECLWMHLKNYNCHLDNCISKIDPKNKDSYKITPEGELYCNLHYWILARKKEWKSKWSERTCPKCYHKSMDFLDTYFSCKSCEFVQSFADYEKFVVEERSKKLESEEKWSFCDICKKNHLQWKKGDTIKNVDKDTPYDAIVWCKCKSWIRIPWHTYLFYRVPPRQSLEQDKLSQEKNWNLSKNSKIVAIRNF